MTPARLALVELARRIKLRDAGGLDARAQAVNPGAEILKSHLFPQQRAVVDDPSPFVAMLCSRRGGKSTAIATILAFVAMAYEGSESAAYCPTLRMAKRNIYNPLRKICMRYRIAAHFNAQEMEVTWPNGSKTYLMGADKADDIDKARGLALHVALVDEAQRFKEHILEELIDEVLLPALEDYEGRLILAGTPKSVCSGYFYAATTDTTRAWSVHKWTVADNIYFPRYVKMQQTDPAYRGMSIREIAEARLAELMARMGWTLDTPKVRREWKGEWARDESSFIYPYDPNKNFAHALPDGHEWRYGMGGDIGMNALVVMAWSRTCPHVYAVAAHKTRFTTIDAFAADIQAYKDKYGTSRIEMDCAALGKYIVDEIRRRHKLVIHAADKQQKATAQEAVRNDLTAGYIKVLPEAKVLVDEWTKLQYDEDGQEPAKADNHCSDAWVYIHKWARHFAAKPAPPPDTRTAAQVEEDKLKEAIFKRAARRTRAQKSAVPRLGDQLRSLLS